MAAANKALAKFASICINCPHDVAVLFWTIRLYFVTLSGSTCISDSAEHAENVSSYISDIQKPFLAWFNKPSIGFQDIFGGNKGIKIKDEIKVC